jgi:hypothetical protein
MPLARPISMGYVADTLVAVLQVVVYDYFFSSFLGSTTQSPNRPMKATPAAIISIFSSTPPGYGSILRAMCYTLFSNMLNICYIWEAGPI